VSSKPVAVIDMGSSAIRMVIAEIDESGHWERLDRAGKPISLGRDVFISGYLSGESMRQAIKILSGFCEVLRGWQVADEDVRVIATSAIREAKNRDTFLDRVYIRTGLMIDIVEGVEENHLTYLAVRQTVSSAMPQFSRSNALIIEVGAGTTEIMMLQRGKMVAAHSLRIGTVRIEQMVQPSWQSTEQLESYLRETIRATREILDAEMKLHRIKYVVAVGGDARLAASQVGERMEGGLRKVSLEPFNEFIDYLQGLGIDEIVSNLGVTYNEAEGLVPALLVLGLFAEATSADHLIVPEVSIREGVLVNFALGTNPEMEREFYEQVIASAYNLGKKYHFDESHAAHVAKLSLSLFDQFREDHGMTRHDRMLLETAAILHDIGNFIRATGHHKHGEYIVANSEIFGLSRSDIRIVSNIVRYHRKAMPNASHTNFISMRREHRVAVMKLASILRVGDALDRSHNQRIRDFRVEKSEDNIILYCDYQGDITVEKYGLELKGQMFEEVFGYRVTIM
jgi:exopolyphosphatase/guanosine-5'-triphosphate,3'-diphosphate pyrophosphatase